MAKKNGSEATTDLASLSGVTSVQKYTEQDAEALLKSSYLPRLQVCGSSAEATKMSLVTMGNWGLILDKERAIDLGKEVDILVICFRPKALELKPADGGTPRSYFNRDTGDFKRVQVRAPVKDSGCMFGLEFLVWLPPESRFVSLYLGNWSSRKEAPSILDEMHKDPATGAKRDIYGFAKVNCKTALTKNAKGQSWHVPKFYPCSSNLSSLPDNESLQAEVELFNNPPESAFETVEAPAGTAEQRAR